MAKHDVVVRMIDEIVVILDHGLVIVTVVDVGQGAVDHFIVIVHNHHIVVVIANDADVVVIQAGDLVAVAIPTIAAVTTGTFAGAGTLTWAAGPNLLPV